MSLITRLSFQTNDRVIVASHGACNLDGDDRSDSARLLTPQAGASLQSQVLLNPAPPYYEAIAIAHGYARVNVSRTQFTVEVRREAGQQIFNCI